VSDDERLDLRDLPPVSTPVAAPARFSQTLLNHADRCPRAAYLYLRHHGGMPSHALNRGSAFHLFAERLVIELMRRGERTLYAVQPGESMDNVRANVSALTEAIVHGIFEEHPELVVSAAEADAVRRMAYHLAVGMDIDPGHVAGVERKFVLDLPCGWTISGKIDLLTLPDAYTAVVDDYKTALYVPTQEEFESSFQTKLYALLVAFGVPVEKRPCEYCYGEGWRPLEGTYAESLAAARDEPGKRRDCEVCGGRGAIEVRLDPIGQHLERFIGRQIYPRFLRDDMRIETREPKEPWTRTDLADFLQDVDRTARRIVHGLETGKWPAVPGSWCSECPSEPECPLPLYLRDWHGSIQSRERAEEAAAWAERMSQRVKRTREEVKEFAKSQPSGAVRVGGGNEVLELTVTQGKAMKRRGRGTDWEGFELALTNALVHGEPFDLREWVRETTSTTFKKRKLSAEERAAFDHNDGEEITR
jgi:hypothetical protein